MILKLTIYGFYIVKRIQIKWKDLKFIHKNLLCQTGRKIYDSHSFLKTEICY